MPTLRRPVRTLVAIAALAPLAAMEAPLVGPRSLGMGGTGVACVDDGTAQFFNPAAFGFFGRGGDQRAPSDNNDLRRRHWGASVDAASGVTLLGDFARYVDELSDARATVDRLTANGVTSAQDIADLVKIGNSLANIGNAGTAFIADGDAGATVRLGRWGLGVRAYGEAVGLVDSVDLQHIGIAVTPGQATLSDAVSSTGAPQATSVTLLTGVTGLSNDALLRLEYAAHQAGVTPAEAQQLATLINAANTQYGADSFSANTTSVLARGVAVAEFPLTFGYALDDHLAFGISPKLLLGRTYAKRVLVFGNGIRDQIDELRSDYEQSTAVSIDAGMMYRMPWFQLGLTGRNLNAPSFRGPEVDGARFPDVTIDPQLTAGAAWMPTPTLAVEVDADLLRAETLLADYDVQRVGFGGEWNLFRTLALRLGTYRNVAQGDIGWVYTGGFGVNLWAVRLDLGGAVTTHTETVNGTDVPSEARVSLRLATEF